MSTEGGNKAVIAALLANSGIAVTKFVAFLLTGASSMLAEAVHSVADSGNQGLLLLGGKRAKRQATPEHPFGFGRERYVYAFVVSIVLFSIGGLFALYEAFHKYEETHAGVPNQLLDSRWWWVPIVVLLAAIVMEGLSFRTAVRESNHSRGSRSWPEFIRRAKAPELPVILLEDFAALIGLVFALARRRADPAHRERLLGRGRHGDDRRCSSSLVAITLAIEMKSLLVGESATPEHQRALAAAISGTDGVDRLIHMKTLHLGPDEVLVGVKIAVTRTDRADDVAEAIDAAERAARAAVPDLQLVMYVEPDLDRSLARLSRRRFETAVPGR